MTIFNFVREAGKQNIIDAFEEVQREYQKPVYRPEPPTKYQPRRAFTKQSDFRSLTRLRAAMKELRRVCIEVHGREFGLLQYNELVRNIHE